MFSTQSDSKAFAALFKSLAEPPPPGTPYALPLPGTERENRTPIYRNWRVKDRELLSTYDPAVATVYDMFEATVARRPNAKCLGARPWNPSTRTWEPRYEWLSYADVAGRRSRIGSGLVEIHRRIGIEGAGYGVGLWSQNRAEWMITGALRPPACFNPSSPLAESPLAGYSRLGKSSSTCPALVARLS